ncbi:MAG TPA: YCF48-related protein [Ignavibacteria bacterium]|nr:YCF48-related protein [Ignavibacteria bacterium]
MKNIKFFLLFILLNTISSNKIYSQWFWQNPIPTGNRINGVEFLNENTGWFVCNAGTIINTTNGGNTFNLNQNITSNNLYDICKYNNYIFISSDSGKIIKSSDNGTHWQVISSNITDVLSSIHFVNENTGWAAGNIRTIYKTINGGINWQVQVQHTGTDLNVVYFINANTGWAGGSGFLRKTTDGGANWFFQTLGSFADCRAIKFLNETTGWICGWSGNLYKTTNAGINWIDKNFTGYNFYSISIIDNNNLIVGGDRTYLTTNSGNNWITISSDSTWLYHPYFVNTNVVYAGASTAIWKSMDGGFNWSKLTPRQLPYMSQNHINFLNETTGWIFGFNGRIIKSTNGGNNWINQSFNNFYPGNSSFINVNTGFLGTFGGDYFKTTNGGNNWEINDTKLNVIKINFINELTGWMLGRELIIKTTNGGLNWTIQYSIEGQGDRFTNIDFFNDQTGLVSCDYGEILRTQNGGSNWTIMQLDVIYHNFFDVDFSNSNVWVAGDSGLVYRSTNYGINWERQMTGVKSVLKSIDFVNDYTGWIVGRNGTIIKTINGGLNWSKQNSYTNYELFSISMVNSNTGWITGDNVTVLKTTNGGEPVNITPIHTSIVSNFNLYQNYPNPFNPTTKITFDIAKSSKVELKIYDSLGKEITTLINSQFLQNGKYIIDFNSQNLPSGIYFYRLKSDNFTQSRKMIILK